MARPRASTTGTTLRFPRFQIERYGVKSAREEKPDPSVFFGSVRNGGTDLLVESVLKKGSWYRKRNSNVRWNKNGLNCVASQETEGGYRASRKSQDHHKITFTPEPIRIKRVATAKQEKQVGQTHFIFQ